MHTLSRAQRIFARVFFLCSISLGLAACVGAPEPAPTESTVSEYTEYQVAVSAGGKDMSLSVQVSSAMSDHYRDTTGRDLDQGAVEDLVRERLRRVIEDGSVEMPTDADGELSLVLDHEEQPADITSLYAQAYDPCVQSLGSSSTSYWFVVRDGLGCRKYRSTDYYDNLYNACNGTTSQSYLYSTTEGPYWISC